MKKTLLLVLTLVLAVACLASCGAKGKTLDQIKDAGKLVIASSPDFPPFESLIDGKVDGIEIEIMNIICERLGVELKIEKVDFDSVLPGVQAGKYDCGVSGISITDSRKKNTLFTSPYCLAAQSIVVTENSPVTRKADLDGKKVSVQTGTTADDFCRSNGYTVSAFKANSDAELALTTGKVDAWVIDNLTAIEMVEVYNAEHEDKLVILDDAMTTEPYAFAFAFGSETLVNEIDGIIDSIIKDGTVASIFEKYGVPYISPVSE